MISEVDHCPNSWLKEDEVSCRKGKVFCCNAAVKLWWGRLDSESSRL